MQQPLKTLMDGNLMHAAMSNCTLARLWRIMLVELDIRDTAWESCLARYIDESQKHLSGKEATNLKGNLPKSLARDVMTFKAFVRGVSVLHFKSTKLTISMGRGDKAHVVEVDIPITYTDDGGKYLKVLWEDIKKGWPEVSDNWNDYMRDYKETYRDMYGKDPANLNSNITSTLKEDLLTWQVFYQGLMVHRFDWIKIQVAFTPHSIGAVKNIAIDVVGSR